MSPWRGLLACEPVNVLAERNATALAGARIILSYAPARSQRLPTSWASHARGSTRFTAQKSGPGGQWPGAATGSTPCSRRCSNRAPSTACAAPSSWLPKLGSGSHRRLRSRGTTSTSSTKLTATRPAVPACATAAAYQRGDTDPVRRRTSDSAGPGFVITGGGRTAPDPQALANRVGQITRGAGVKTIHAMQRAFLERLQRDSSN